MSWEEPVFEAKVESVLKNCSAGHDVGDVFEINTHKTDGICGWCYHDLFPTLMTLCMDGKIPWRENQDEWPTSALTGTTWSRSRFGENSINSHFLSFVICHA